MTSSEWSYLLESFCAETCSDGFTPQEGGKLLSWWLYTSRDEAWVSVGMPQFANCIETDTQEIP